MGFISQNGQPGSAFDNSTAELSSETKRDMLQAGGAGVFWNPAEPPPSSLIPELLNTDKLSWDPNVEEWASSFDIINFYTEHGDTVQEVGLYYYRMNTLAGKGRRLDNSDLLTGKEPVYGTLDNLKEVIPLIQKLQKKMHARLDDDPSLAAKAELENLDKICFQQIKPTGYFNDPIVATDYIPDRPNPLFKEMCQIVCDTYAKVLATKAPDVWRMSLKELTLLDSDPQTTMTGMPTLVSGDRTHEGRIATLRAIPNPLKYGDDSRAWFQDLCNLESTLGFDPGMMWSSVASTRFGPTSKPIIAWAYDGPGSGYRAVSKSVGYFNRVRNVFPASYIINFTMSPIYKLMSTARQNILGLWHDPVSTDAYVKALNAQGKFPYSVDFHGMDTHMIKWLINTMVECLIKAGFPKGPLEKFKMLYNSSGILMPSSAGSVNAADYITGDYLPWTSGLKVTSEFDTLYGLTCLLCGLSKQIPGIVDMWRSGKFVIAELGDDIIFTSPKKLETEALSEFLSSQFGAYLDINEDVMFLMRMLPLCGALDHLCRPISRLIQQSFCNEDRYTGKEGGDTPPAVMRLGLIGRMEGIKYNPFWPEFKDDLLELLNHLQYVKNAPASFKASLAAGEPVLPDEDYAAILQYSSGSSHYLESLRERAKYNAGSAYLMTLLEQRGIQMGQTAGEVAIREEYWNAYTSDTTPEAVAALRVYTDNVLYGVTSATE